MEVLLEKLESYSLSKVLNDYCSELRKIETEEALYTQQPISRYESDFVSVTSPKDFNTFYRTDYISDVGDSQNLLGNSISSGNTAVKTESQTPSCGVTNSMVEKMRLLLNNGSTTRDTHIELLAKLDIYLDKMNRCKNGYTELSKSIPQCAYSSFKDLLLKKDNTRPETILSTENHIKSDIKQPIRRRGGFKRKLVSITIAMHSLYRDNSIYYFSILFSILPIFTHIFHLIELLYFDCILALHVLDTFSFAIV